MIAHIVLCKPKDASSPANKTDLENALAQLSRVPGVQGFSTGEDFSGRGQGYTEAMIMYFRDRASLQTYMTHPEHLRVVDILNQVAPERLVIDYETGSNGISATGDSHQSPS